MTHRQVISTLITLISSLKARLAQSISRKASFSFHLWQLALLAGGKKEEKKIK